MFLKLLLILADSGKPMIINKKIEDLSLMEISKNNFGKDVYHHFLIKK